jgi:RNA polymerase sigma-70 factor, ECF subfamily
MDRPEQQRDEQVVQLISGCQRRLFLYLLGLLCSRDLAEDALQETNTVLWRKRLQYTPGTNFFAWACNVAYFEACKARKKQRQQVPAFSDVFLQGVAPELAAAAESADPLLAALQDCMARLAERDRELIRLRYDDGVTTQSLAANVGRSPDSVYKSLSRIHQSLFDCITRKLNEDDRP